MMYLVMITQGFFLLVVRTYFLFFVYVGGTIVLLTCYLHGKYLSFGDTYTLLWWGVSVSNLLVLIGQWLR